MCLTIFFIRNFDQKFSKPSTIYCILSSYLQWIPIHQMLTVHTERLLAFTENTVNHRHNSLQVVFLRETDINLIRLERLVVRISGLFCIVMLAKMNECICTYCFVLFDWLIWCSFCGMYRKVLSDWQVCYKKIQQIGWSGQKNQLFWAYWIVEKAPNIMCKPMSQKCKNFVPRCNRKFPNVTDNRSHIK